MDTYKRGHQLLEPPYKIPEPTFIKLVESGKLIPLEKLEDVPPQELLGRDYGRPPGMRRIFLTRELQQLRDDLAAKRHYLKTTQAQLIKDDANLEKEYLGYLKWEAEVRSVLVRTGRGASKEDRKPLDLDSWRKDLPETRRQWAADAKKLASEIKELEVELDPSQAWKVQGLSAGQEEELRNRLVNAHYEISHDEALELSDKIMGSPARSVTGPAPISDEVISLLKDAGSEVKKLWKSTLKARKLGDSDYQELVLGEFDQREQYWRFIKREYLMDASLYIFTVKQEWRDFCGRILRKIVKGRGLGDHGAQELFKLYRKIEKGEI